MSKLSHVLSGVLVVLVLAVSALPASAASWKFIQLHKFAGSDPRQPLDGPILDNSGNLYGTTYYGGAFAKGTIYRVAPDGTLVVLHDFGASGDGQLPLASLTRDKAGNFYGTTQYGGAYGQGTVFELSADGTEKVLYSFKATDDGRQPFTRVIKIGRYLYGTTPSGGVSDCQFGAGACGVVFKISLTGSETILHAFTGGDGAQPYATVVADKEGNLYGTTMYGGIPDGCAGGSNYGCGTVFKITPDGTETTIHRFVGYPNDGGNPDGDLIFDSLGNLYGTSQIGGSSTYCYDGATGCGSIFKIATDGTVTILYSFTGGTVGDEPRGALVQDKEEDLFGTTYLEVFELALDGSLKRAHRWSNFGHSVVNRNLVFDKSGNLFGTTASDSRHPGGSVFELKRQ